MFKVNQLENDLIITLKVCKQICRALICSQTQNVFMHVTLVKMCMFMSRRIVRSIGCSRSSRGFIRKTLLLILSDYKTFGPLVCCVGLLSHHKQTASEFLFTMSPLETTQLSVSGTDPSAIAV